MQVEKAKNTCKMQVMTEAELQTILSENIKKYRKGKFTQETLAETIKVSTQNINDIEGKRRFPRISTIVKIANTLGIEVYQLFVPPDTTSVIIEDTPENEKIYKQIQSDVISNVRLSVNKLLDKIGKS